MKLPTQKNANEIYVSIKNVIKLFFLNLIIIKNRSTDIIICKRYKEKKNEIKKRFIKKIIRKSQADTLQRERIKLTLPLTINSL